MSKKNHAKKHSNRPAGASRPQTAVTVSAPPALPEAFLSRVQMMLGEEDFTAFCDSYNDPAHHALRLQPRKAEAAPAAVRMVTEIPAASAGDSAGEDAFASAGTSAEQITSLTPVPWVEGAFDYTDQQDETAFGKSPLHEAGLYYIQEPSAMTPVTFLDAPNRHHVLDLCAAPGGKSTQIAGLLSQDALLVSNEPIPSRAKILSENLERMGAANAIVTNAYPADLADRFPEFFDAILVDAPCSGEGMFRKNPMARSEWTPDSPHLCAERDDEILDAADAMLSPGGRLVFSTCTFAPEENEGSILRFLTRHDNYRIVDPKDALVPAGMDAAAENLRSAHIPGVANGAAEALLSAHIPGAAGGLSEDVLCAFDLGTEKTPGEEIPQALYAKMSKCIRLWPHREAGEGHFVAVLEKDLLESDSNYYSSENERNMNASVLFKDVSALSKGASDTSNGDPDPSDLLKAALRSLSRSESVVVSAFLTETIRPAVTSAMLQSHSLVTAFGDQLWLLPKDAPSLDHLRVLRAGLHLGTLITSRRDPSSVRFEPAFALALALNPMDVFLTRDLSYSEAVRYVRGEALPDSSEDEHSGWCLLSVQGASIGWGKCVSGTIKNSYPKGLRKDLG